MCTPSNPERRSVRQCSRTLLVATWATVRAFGALLLALVTAPSRLGHADGHHRVRPASTHSIDIQIHLEDPRCRTELQRVLRSTLKRAAATWAPMQLPVHRVVVGAGFPADGKADIYDQFSDAAHAADPTRRQASRLVVISLGLRTSERDLEPFELAGALAAQIQRVVDDVHGHHIRCAVEASPAGSTAATGRLSRPNGSAESVAGARSQSVDALTSDGTALTDRLAGSSMPRLQELLATVQEGQPLTAAGPVSPSTNP